MTGTANYLVTSGTENYFFIGAENYFSRRYRELIFFAYNTLRACDGGGLARVFPARFSSSLSAGSASSALPSGNRSSGSSSGSSGSLVSELHRRFPLLLRGAETALIPKKRVDRPSNAWNEFAIKDIIIVGLQCETPITRQEKVSHQRRNRVINGFAIDKGWNENSLQ